MPGQRRGRPPHDDILTPAEWRVLHAVQHGLSNRGIAARMGVSVDAIKYHVRNIEQKTGHATKRSLRLYFQKPRASMLAPRPEEESMTTAEFGKIGQISRSVSDIDASRNWYELVLELPHLYTFGKLSFFDCDGTRLMLSQEGELNRNESILYFKVADIAGTFERLQRKGVEFIAAPHRIHRHEDGTEEWMGFFKDPDGRPLALMAQVKG
jgi:DNA-binding CsgD family transcriptional regulator/catechol 2,3-dioxygenase-like lactoylglutathione lyase family enzyme